MMRVANSQGGLNATLAWIVEGTKELFSKKEECETFLLLPKIVADASAEVVSNNDSFKQFIAEECDVWTPECADKRETYLYGRQLVKNGYYNFVKRNKELEPSKLDNTAFAQRMQSLFGNGKNTGAWVGIRQKEN